MNGHCNCWKHFQAKPGNCFDLLQLHLYPIPYLGISSWKWGLNQLHSGEYVVLGHRTNQISFRGRNYCYVYHNIRGTMLSLFLSILFGAGGKNSVIHHQPFSGGWDGWTTSRCCWTIAPTLIDIRLFLHECDDTWLFCGFHLLQKERRTLCSLCE